MAIHIAVQEITFLVLAGALLVWAQWRLPKPAAAFPGPRPVGPVFKVWLVIIWVVGLLLPLLALAVDGWLGGRAVELLGEAAPLLTVVTLYALVVLWVINIGVHYTNIPATLRWDYHARDSVFPSLHDPRVFVAKAQDKERK
ncbi:MAG: hypothetical protein IPG25_17275 [Proteobacteria bacterium]|nr:hypothetical protein [Pseudomonadota bacterium]